MTNGYDNMDGKETTDARVSALLAAYGARPDGWPPAERAAADSRISMNTELRVEHDAEVAFDALLDRAAPVIASEQLYAKVIFGFDRHDEERRQSLSFRIRTLIASLRDAVWPGAPLWQPLCALSLALVIGLSAGILVPEVLNGRDSSTDQMTADVIGSPPSADVNQVD